MLGAFALRAFALFLRDQNPWESSQGCFSHGFFCFRQKIQTKGTQTMEKPQFSKQLKKAMIDREMSQKTLAELSRLPRQYINMIANGRLNPTFEQQCRIAKALNVDPAKVFDREVVNGR
jgi:DNA-binding XRE family transcriptional regulator